MGRKHGIPAVQSRELQFAFSLSGLPLRVREFSLTENQRQKIRRLLERPYDEFKFGTLIRKVEFQAQVHRAFRGRTRFSPPAVKHALLTRKRAISAAKKQLSLLSEIPQYLDFLQFFVQQTHTQDEYWQSIVRAGRAPKKGIFVPKNSSSEEFEAVLKKANAQAIAENRIPLRKLSIEELLQDSFISLTAIEGAVDRALANLDSIAPKAGRKRDVWRVNLIAQLANLYAEYLGCKPTATYNNDFHRFVDLVFNAIDWPQQGRRKLILSALRQRKGS